MEPGWGMEYEECSKCGFRDKGVEYEIPALGHTPGETITTENGTYTVCARCGDWYQ
jgi:ribosomal protein L37E